MASLLAMFVIFVVVTLAHYVIPILIVGTVTWVVLVVWLRGHPAISAQPGVAAQPEPTPGPTVSRTRQDNLVGEVSRRGLLQG